MNYTKDDVESLARNLESLPYQKFGVLADFLWNHVESGHLDLGLSVPGSPGSALVVTEMEQMFPDALEALRIPQEDLAGFLDERVGQEHPIAVWRLARGT